MFLSWTVVECERRLARLGILLAPSQAWEHGSLFWLHKFAPFTTNIHVYTSFLSGPDKLCLVTR